MEYVQDFRPSLPRVRGPLWSTTHAATCSGSLYAPGSRSSGQNPYIIFFLRCRAISSILAVLQHPLQNTSRSAILINSPTQSSNPASHGNRTHPHLHRARHLGRIPIELAQGPASLLPTPHIRASHAPLCRRQLSCFGPTSGSVALDT